MLFDVAANLYFLEISQQGFSDLITVIIFVTNNIIFHIFTSTKIIITIYDKKVVNMLDFKCFLETSEDISTGWTY